MMLARVTVKCRERQRQQALRTGSPGAAGEVTPIDADWSGAAAARFARAAASAILAATDSVRCVP
jgi:hypothetical protein